mgnify:CR=1 FL=1
MARSSRGATCGAGRRAFARTPRQFCKTADGAHVPLQARRSRARRLRLRVAAGAARTCVARRQPPRPLTRWPSPRRRGPRSPCDELCGPAECPTSLRSQCQRLLFAKNNTFPSSAGAPARLVGRAPSSTIRTHLAPAAQPPVALAGAVAVPSPPDFGRVQAKLPWLLALHWDRVECNSVHSNR